MSDQHNTEQRVRFGARHWQHADWVGGYYPEDLPEDWRLGYYANELGAVLLPDAAWRGLDGESLADWALDVHDDFRFYLAVAAEGGAPDPEALGAAFGDLLGGLLWEGEAAPAGLLAPYTGELPDGVRAWGDGEGIRLALLDLHGLDLRGRRAVLERLAPVLARGDAALILDWDGVSPGEIRELQTVAELLGIA